MIRSETRPVTTDWDALGRTLGESLSAFHSLVVCGMDVDATARVAIALARVQATQRRVAVGDLIGDAPALRALVPDDDEHGLVDSFLYGISLTRIARPVAGVGDLYLLPTGSELPDYEEILAQPRWARLASGFRELGALLVLVVPADAPRIAELVAQTDGAIIVGDQVPATLPVAYVVTILRTTKSPTASNPTPASVPTAPLPDEAPAVTGSVHSRTSGPAAAKLPWPWPDPSAPVEIEAPRSWISMSFALAVGLAMTVALVLCIMWLLRAPRAHDVASTRPIPVTDTTRLTPVLDSDGVPIGTARPESGAGAVLRPANPGDSAGAAQFAVRLTTANTEAGAILKVQDDSRDLPAVTFAPRIYEGSRWFEVLCGAFAHRTGADSLLNDLRARKVIDSTSGVVVRVSYAFLIDSIDAGTAAAAVPGLIADHLQRGLPAYALRQDNGTAWILVGAFETPEQAALYEASLRASATFVVPTLVYRKGRTF